MPPKDVATLTFYGATETVTGSKFLLSAGEDTHVLVDCGLFQGYKELRLRYWQPLPIEAGIIDAVLLTHAHIDHSGYLPRLVRDGFSGPVFCTSGTADLARLLLPDAAKLEEEDGARQPEGLFEAFPGAATVHQGGGKPRAAACFPRPARTMPAQRPAARSEVCASGARRAVGQRRPAGKAARALWVEGGGCQVRPRG